MVHRHPLSRLRWTTAGVAAGVAALALVGVRPARAADAKVAIGHYQWSHPVVHVDLGQRVTWYWVGPDTEHSVTGISANDLTDDSDPGRLPDHHVGSTFRLTFTQPGVYQFQCKLHPVVQGEVIVSATPGDPADDPDPTPRLNVDLTRPTLTGLFLSRAAFRAGTGATLNLALDDPSLIDAEIWHVAHGHRSTYAGWQTWRAHIGFNYLSFGVRGRHFRPAPGRYVAFVRATDLFSNVSTAHRIAFRILPAPHPRRRAR
ncbi:MAG: cupredoxin domain-containing protein [Solirubrobacteraceae bacterium]